MSVSSGLSTSGENGFSSLESILGPLLIGTFLSTALWGVTSVQTYDYFINPNEDRLWQKLIVALLCILGTFETIMNTHVLYHYLVNNFANPYALVSTTWSASCRSLLIALSTFIVRTMFARRIYLVSKKNITLTSWIMAISLADLVMGIVSTVKLFTGLSSGALLSQKKILYLSLSIGIASDVSVTLALYWLLSAMKTGFSKTDSIVEILILYGVTTGLLVVINATLGIVFYAVMPDNLTFFVFYLLLGKLYISAYLASLNGRKKIQTGVDVTTSRRTNQNRQTMDKPSVHLPAMAITLQTTIERRTDDHEVENNVV